MIDDLLAAAASRGLHELVLRESIGGWQAVAKFHGALGGPWGVGCDADPIEAARKALAAPAPSEKTTAMGGIFA